VSPCRSLIGPREKIKTYKFVDKKMQKILLLLGFISEESGNE
jgi:hypothetical protein